MTLFAETECYKSFDTSPSLVCDFLIFFFLRWTRYIYLKLSTCTSGRMMYYCVLDSLKYLRIESKCGKVNSAGLTGDKS